MSFSKLSCQIDRLFILIYLHIYKEISKALLKWEKNLSNNNSKYNFWPILWVVSFLYSMRPSLENTSDPDEIRELALLVIRNKHKITQQEKNYFYNFHSWKVFLAFSCESDLKKKFFPRIFLDKNWHGTKFGATTLMWWKSLCKYSIAIMTCLGKK